MKFETLVQDEFKSLSVQVETPEGSMFVHIIEDDSGRPIAMDIHIGKAGSLVQAWAKSLSRLVTVALEHGVTIEEVIEELSSQRSDRRRTDVEGRVIGSGPDGIYHALMKYKKNKFDATRKVLGIEDDDASERKGRVGRLAR